MSPSPKSSHPPRSHKIFGRRLSLTPATPASPQTSNLEIIHRRTSSTSSLSRSYSMAKGRTYPKETPNVWGPGLFQCKRHIDVVKGIGKMLGLSDAESLFQPLDPISMRGKVDKLISRFMEDCKNELIDGDQRDILMLFGALAFMRLGCHIPASLLFFVNRTVWRDTILPMTTLSPQAIIQVRQALDIYQPGAFYIFDTAPLEMLPLLAETQEWRAEKENDEEDSTASIEDSSEERSIAASSLKRIASIDQENRAKMSGVVKGIKTMLKISGKKENLMEHKQGT